MHRWERIAYVYFVPILPIDTGMSTRETGRRRSRADSSLTNVLRNVGWPVSSFSHATTLAFTCNLPQPTTSPRRHSVSLVLYTYSGLKATVASIVNVVSIGMHTCQSQIAASRWLPRRTLRPETLRLGHVSTASVLTTIADPLYHPPPSPPILNHALCSTSTTSHSLSPAKDFHVHRHPNAPQICDRVTCHEHPTQQAHETMIFLPRSNCDRIRKLQHCSRR